MRGSNELRSKYVLFWSGPFSNWHPSRFTKDGMSFNCGEQYMMYHKAKHFGDDVIAKKIMEEDHPRDQKRLGRKIRGYIDSEWSGVRRSIVKEGLREKFLQNPGLKEELLKNKGKIFVEASPYDRIWGIGYGEEDALDNIPGWGQNLLGEILTELSNELD